VCGIKNKSIIHNSFDPKKFNIDSEEFFTKENDSLKLCAVGSISVQKGILELLEAVAICKDKGLNVNLYIVGEYEKTSKSKIVSQILKEVKGSSNIQEDVRKTIAKYDLQDVVIFSGFVSNLSLVYEKIDVLCFVSRFNAPGRPIFEAAYFNKPSIVAIDRSWDDTIIDKKTGLLVQVKCPQSIADAIEFMINNPNERIRMGNYAYKLNRKNFDPVCNVKLICNLYESILLSQDL
jgi:glycosyltransferase involved in cell wall biosynthesis